MTFNSNAIHTLNWSLRHTRLELVRFHKKKSQQNSTCILNKSWPPTSKITIHITEHQRKHLLVYPRKQVQYWPLSAKVAEPYILETDSNCLNADQKWCTQNHPVRNNGPLKFWKNFFMNVFLFEWKVSKHWIYNYSKYESWD